MNELINNKLFWVAIAIFIVIGVIFSASIIVDKVTEKVIDSLMRDYVPGPYSPGFDPDKVNPNFWRDNPNAPKWEPKFQGDVGTKTSWEDQWEQMRLQ